MPKLGMGSDFMEMRKQLACMLHEGILDGKKEVGDYVNSNSVFTWSEAEITVYYQKNVTDAMVDAYDAVIERNKATQFGPQDRPTEVSFHLLDKMEHIAEISTSQEDREEKLEQIREAFELTQLGYDAAHNALDTEEKKKRYQTLKEKYSIEEYGKRLASIKETQDELANIDAIINSKFPVYPKKPIAKNFLTKIFSRKYKEDLRKYEELRGYLKKKSLIEEKIATAQYIMDNIKENNLNYNYEEHFQKQEDRCLELAKHIVRKTLSDQHGNAPALSDEELEVSAKAIMATKGFQKLVKELKADTTEVNPNTFYSKFLKEMSDQHAAANEKNNDTKPVEKANGVKPEDKETKAKSLS